MTIFLLLLGAHFIGDFYLQPDRWIACRHQYGLRSPALYFHAAVHCVLALIALYLADVGLYKGLVAGAVITVSHFLIDWVKAGKRSPLAFAIDQLAHVLIIILVSLSFHPQPLWEIVNGHLTNISSDTLLYVVAYLLIFKPASIIIAQLLAQYTSQLNGAEGESLGNAGKWIGYVERLLALSFILVDEYTGLGFLVATKTVFRVGDLSRQRDMRLTEYMMLGTLMSFAAALIVGWTVVAVSR
ncbi:DUF3307 domain-containing protein [Alteromonas sp. C1M14]|uniref:DUF3307 domain-containing protein n=1 Tax=Alteromonas sp. C1M14 TaxID=2841567 RepID=UPI001C09752E|nr:DUF3307 domain-containing protein [Alteromonas sp. C1M14]MBU2976909.1 DUF3307 domain-containing protein [Alteromonas sp. C1M14]